MSCFYFPFSDPEHQRAKGNLKYFEFQLEKQKKTEAEKETQNDTEEKKETTQKIKKKKSKKVFSLIPERKKYEMLCRGEGIRMVSQGKTRRTSQILTFKVLDSFNSSVLSPLSFRHPAERAGCSVVTMTTITTPNMYCHLSNSKMSGTAPTLFVTLTSSRTKKLRKSRNWQNHE